MSSHQIPREDGIDSLCCFAGLFGRTHYGVVYVQDESEKCYEQKVIIKTVTGELLSLPYGTCYYPSLPYLMAPVTARHLPYPMAPATACHFPYPMASGTACH